MADMLSAHEQTRCLPRGDVCNPPGGAPFPTPYARMASLWRLTRRARRGVATVAETLPDAADVVVLGGGHNGLVAAAYLARAGLSVCVLERRHVMGGAAVTEELQPGFRYSRASYLAGLLRPPVVSDLQLERHGLRYLVRDPSSFTPSLPGSRHRGKSLLLHSDTGETQRSIAQFSKSDADAYPAYEAFLGSVRQIVNPLIDGPPIDFASTSGRCWGGPLGPWHGHALTGGRVCLRVSIQRAHASTLTWCASCRSTSARKQRWGAPLPQPRRRSCRRSWRATR